MAVPPPIIRLDAIKEGQLDATIAQRWPQVQQNVVPQFLTGDIRVIKGAYGLSVLHCPNRATKRTPLRKFTSVEQPFDPGTFNFNKIRKEEIIAQIETKDDNDQTQTHLLLINLSPVDTFHSLLIPCPALCLNQCLTKDSILLAVSLIAKPVCGLVEKPDSSQFIVFFNSLLAFASVNHLHFQLVKPRVELPILKFLRENSITSNFEKPTLITNFVAPFLVVPLIWNSSQFANDIMRAVQKCIELSHAYVVLFLRCGSQTCAFLIPKIRDILIDFSPEFEFTPAALESAGYLMAPRKDHFEDLTEKQALEILAQSTPRFEILERIFSVLSDPR